MPLVSIVVPNYNHARFLVDRLDSILAQDFDDYEVLLLDDASTDESQALLSRYAQHPKVSAVLINAVNSGSTFRQWNKGVEAATGRYVWIAESDDRAAPALLGRLVAAMEADPQRALAYCQSRRIDQDGRVMGDWRGWTEKLAPGLVDTDFDMDGRAFMSRLLLHRNVLPNASAVLFRRDAYLACGGADPAVPFCGDWFVWLKLALHGRIYFHADALNDFRQHDNSVIARRAAERRDVFRKRYDILMRQALDARLASLCGLSAQQLRRLNLALLSREAAVEAALLTRHGRADEAHVYRRMALERAPLERRLWLGFRLAVARLAAQSRVARGADRSRRPQGLARSRSDGRSETAS